MSTITSTAIATDDTDEVVRRTKPTVAKIAAAVRQYDTKAGERMPFFDGVDVAYHVVTKGEMVKVARYLAREDKQRDHLRGKLEREDRQSERDLLRAKRAEATRRMEAANAAMRQIAAATIKNADV